MNLRKVARTPGTRAGLLCVTAVGGYFIANALLPLGIPVGTLLLGISFGLLYALGSVGMIVTYRAGRYLNLSLGVLGVAGAVLAYQLILYRGWPWYAGAAVGLVGSMGLGALCEAIVVRRFFGKSRLLVSIATIGLIQVLLYVVAIIESYIAQQGQLGTIVASPVYPSPPFPLRFTIGYIVFGSSNVLIIIVAPVAIVCLALFFKRSRYGMLFEAGAQNLDLARVQGISVRSLSTYAWVIAGFFTGLLAILEGPVRLLDTTDGGFELLVLILAPAMIAGLEGFALAVFAAVVLGVTQQAIALNTNNEGIFEVVLFGIVVAALLLRRNQLGTEGRTSEPSLALGMGTRPFPRGLKGDPRLRRLRLSARAAAVAAAVVVPIGENVIIERKLTTVLVYAIVGLSLVVLNGFAGQVSFGQFAIVGIAALYGEYLVTSHGLNFWIGLLLVPVGGAVLSTVVGLPALQIRGIFLGITTLAFAVAASDYLFTLPQFSSATAVAAPSILGLSLASGETYYYFVLVILAAMFIWTAWLRTSTLGRNMAAVRDNSQAAATYGVRVVRTRLLAFTISGFMAALAGYLFLYTVQAPNAAQFTPETSLMFFAVVIVAGSGAPMGGVIAALVLEGVLEFLPGPLQALATGAGLLVILMLAPQGLTGLIFTLRDRFLDSYVRRRGLGVGSAPGGTDPSTLVASTVDLRAEDDVTTVDALIEEAR